MDGALIANVKLWTPSNQYLSSGSNFDLYSLIESDSCQMIYQRISDGTIVTSDVLPLKIGVNEINIPTRVPNAINVIASVNDTRINITPRRFGATRLTNFRDAGGLPLLEGGVMVRNRYYRSENLSKVDREDIAFFNELGIKRVVDLRKPEEKLTAPTPNELRDKITVIEVPISSQIAGFEDGLDAILTKKISAITSEDMAAMYLEILDIYSDILIELAQQTVDFSSGSTLIHCTAGKDRTGILIALIQLAHGVAKEYVYHDYLLSNAYRTPFRMESLRPILHQSGIDIEKFKAYLSAPLEAIDTVFEHLQILSSQLSVSNSAN